MTTDAQSAYWAGVMAAKLRSEEGSTHGANSPAMLSEIEMAQRLAWANLTPHESCCVARCKQPVVYAAPGGLSYCIEHWTRHLTLYTN